MLKHLFAMDGIVFVLAVNRDQLEHSVRALYGSDFDARIYLRRFIDVDIRLPDTDRQDFVGTQINGILSQLRTIRGDDGREWRVDVLAVNWMQTFFGNSGPDLRTVQQALHRLGLMFAMLGSDGAPQMRSDVFALILRTLDPQLYIRFIRDDASDDEVAATLFGRTGEEYRYGPNGRELECEIVMARVEDHFTRHGAAIPGNSHLLTLYSETVDGAARSGKAASPEEDHAAAIIEFVKDAWRQRDRRRGIMWFRNSVDRLALVSENRRV